MAGKVERRSSPIRIPKAISNYTASTLDPELRSSVNSRLLTDGHIQRIHDAILHALHASPTNWPTRIQDHALALLRNGECTTFHELLERVLEDIRADTAVARSSTNYTSSTSSINGHNAVEKSSISNSNKNYKKTEAIMNGSEEIKQSLALPSNVVEEGLKITREYLDIVCEPDD